MRCVRKITAWVGMTILMVAQSASALDENNLPKEEMKNSVQAAVDYLKQNGEEATFAEFNKPDSPFVKGASYIFVVDYKGNILANVGDPNVIGKNQMDIKDVKGRSVVRALIEKAKLGGGWVSYYWKNPTTQKEECKTSFVQPYDKKLVVGSGIYHQPNGNGECKDFD